MNPLRHREREKPLANKLVSFIIIFDGGKKSYRDQPWYFRGAWKLN